MLAFVAVLATGAVSAFAHELDEMALDRYQKVREAERYQLKIADDYYKQRKYDVAADEYEKFLTLYERSEAAPYCQLKWSICQRNLRKLNTAISEGFQSVVDYWPDSPDAIAAMYYIGNTYKDMGEVSKAKKAFKEVLEAHPRHLASARAAVDMIELAKIDDDIETQVEMWKLLTFDTERTRESYRLCENASRDLAVYDFTILAFNDGVKALETTYPKQADLSTQTTAHIVRPINTLMTDEKTKQQGEKLADMAIAYMREHIPDAATEEAKQEAMQHWYHIADIEGAAQREAEVIKVYQQVLDKYGAQDPTLGRLAAWYKAHQNYDNARKVFGQFADKTEGQNQIAQTYRDQKQYDSAVRIHRELSVSDPDNEVKWIGQVAYTWRYYAHNYPEAIKVYQELVKLDVENIDTWMFALADAYHHAGKYTEAIAHYRQCNSNYPETFFRMASCNRAMKKYSEAILLYGQIIGTEPGAASRAQLEVGRTLEEQGQTEQAILAYQKVCKQYPKSGDASTAHAHLQNKYKISVTLGGAKDK